MSAHLSRFEMFAVGLLGILAAVLCTASFPAAAHGHYHVEPYAFTVGWIDEPAVVGAPNGLDLGIELVGPANSSEPVTGVAGDLTATLMWGGESAVRALEPRSGDPGSYTFQVIPTRAGSYTVRIQGTLNGTAIDFTAELEAPEERSELEFPAVDPTPHELQAALDDALAALALSQANATALQTRVAALEASGGGGAASTATLIGLIALAAGVAGVAIGVMAWRKPKAPK